MIGAAISLLIVQRQAVTLFTKGFLFHEDCQKILVTRPGMSVRLRRRQCRSANSRRTDYRYRSRRRHSGVRVFYSTFRRRFHANHRLHRVMQRRQRRACDREQRNGAHCGGRARQCYVLRLYGHGN